MTVPLLAPHEGSWVVVDRKTGKAACELFSRSLAEKVNQAKYEIVTIGDWLSRINQKESR